MSFSHNSLFFSSSRKRKGEKKRNAVERGVIKQERERKRASKNESESSESESSESESES